MHRNFSHCYPCYEVTKLQFAYWSFHHYWAIHLSNCSHCHTIYGNLAAVSNVGRKFPSYMNCLATKLSAIAWMGHVVHAGLIDFVHRSGLLLADGRILEQLKPWLALEKLSEALTAPCKCGRLSVGWERYQSMEVCREGMQEEEYEIEIHVVEATNFYDFLRFVFLAGKWLLRPAWGSVCIEPLSHPARGP